jgi:hypothetical protein
MIDQEFFSSNMELSKIRLNQGTAYSTFSTLFLSAHYFLVAPFEITHELLGEYFIF